MKRAWRWQFWCRMRAFWVPSGVIFEGFWTHLEVKNCFFGSVLVGPRFGKVLEASWRGFRRVVEAPRGGFSKDFGIFFGCWLRNKFFYAFRMIFDGFSCPPDKQKWAFRMEGVAKIKLSCWLLSKAYADRFWKDFGPGLETILASNGAEMRLRKEMLYSMDFRERAQARLRSGQRVKNYLSG